MKKFTSILLALVLVVSMFALTSCEKKAEELLSDADKFLAENPYTTNMKMNFSSDNAEMNEIFKMMNMEVPVTVDGNNLSMDMSMDMMGETMTIKMTVVEKVLYYELGFAGESQKMKANLSDEQLKDFMVDQSVEMPVGYSQFAELKVEKKDSKTIITCEGITDEGKKALNDEIATSLEGLDCTSEIGNLSYVITLKDGKYESMDLSCTYSVTAEGETVSLTMGIGATFAYENVSAVTAPADASSYTTVNYDDLMG